MWVGGWVNERERGDSVWVGGWVNERERGDSVWVGGWVNERKSGDSVWVGWWVNERGRGDSGWVGWEVNTVEPLYKDTPTPSCTIPNITMCTFSHPKCMECRLCQNSRNLKGYDSCWYLLRMMLVFMIHAGIYDA